MSDASKAYPRRTEQNRPFFDGLAEGELRLQHCRQCGHTWFPPASNCPNCLATEFEWRATLGTGTLWSWVVMHKVYFKGFADVPYNVAMVRLDEGPLMISSLVDVADGDIECDLRVQAIYESSDGGPLVKFRPLVQEQAAL